MILMFRRTTAHAKFHYLVLLFQITSCVFEKEGLLFTLNNTPPLRGAFRLPFATDHGPSGPAPAGQPPLHKQATGKRSAPCRSLSCFIRGA